MKNINNLPLNLKEFILKNIYSVVFILVLVLTGCGANSILKFGNDSAKMNASAQARQEQLNFEARTLEADFLAADKFIARGELNEAQILIQRIIKRTPNNVKAQEVAKKIEQIKAHSQLIDQAEALIKKKDIDNAKTKLNLVLSENPSDTKARKLLAQIDTSSSADSLRLMLAPAFHKPITIDFQDASLKQIFTIIGQTAGINFIFDKDVKLDQKNTLALKDSTVEAAIYSMLTVNQLEQQIMDGKTLLIYPNNAAKIKEYQQTIVKSFMLTNARAKGVAESLKTILKSREVVVDEKLNMLIVRDSPEAITLIEKIISLQDFPEPEVMLELEVLEVSRDRMLELGITPPGNIGLTLLPPNAVFSDLAKIGRGNVVTTIDQAAIKAKGTDTDFDILASPRVRVINREKAKILIGNKVPTITSTVIPGVSGSSTAETIAYIDVGLKLEIEPTIFLNGEVAIKVGLEVSSIVDKLTTKQGSVAYTVGNRNASTVLRLKDGENQILAGLINSETDRTINKFPGLGDLPVLGNLFKNQSNSDKKTEILLSITPRLVRNLQRQEASLNEFMGGTDSSLRLRPDFKVTALEQVISNPALNRQSVEPPKRVEQVAPPASLPPKNLPSPLPTPNIPLSILPNNVNSIDRSVAPLVIQLPQEDRPAKTNPEKPRAGQQRQDKAVEKKKAAETEKTSAETRQFIENLLKQNSVR